ncbi:hypothetical protein [Microbacterium sp. CH12i]|uniref:hypothetical protein n=1 Tax=Microbacterium sp. CH12i TaxID=1479651 RepID=UPI0012682436|nr:hypothetical protein [Microbacterium sp. CH12i]
MEWSEVEIRGARLRRNEMQLLRMALAALSTNNEQSGLYGMLNEYVAELSSRSADFVNVLEAIAYTAAQTYLPSEVGKWLEGRRNAPEHDIVFMLIRWAIDALDRPEGSPDRELPVQAIRNQAAEIVESRTEKVILTDLVLATAFMADTVKLQELLSAKEAFAQERLGGNSITWRAGPA